MTDNITVDKFDSTLIDKIESTFPLIAMMARKNDYDGLPIYFLKERGEIASIAIVDPEGFNGRPKLCAFEVAMKFRRCKYGTRLLEFLISEYRKLRANVLREALGFYLKSFFRIVEDTGGPVITVESAF